MKLVVSTPPRGRPAADLSILREGSNFGDELNFKIWPTLLGGAVTGWLSKSDRTGFAALSSGDATLFALGSLLQDVADSPARKVLFGAGYGWSVAPRLGSDWEPRFVRGPLTAEILGLDPRAEGCDGAYALRLLPAWREAPPHDPAGPIVAIPHANNRIAKALRWAPIRAAVEIGGVRWLNVRADPDAVLTEILAAGRVVSEAMHGAILADALRRPWISAQMGEPVGELKWHDWARSMNVLHRPETLVRSWRKASTAQKAAMATGVGARAIAERLSDRIAALPAEQARLSPDATLRRKLAFLEEEISRLIDARAAER